MSVKSELKCKQVIKSATAARRIADKLPWCKIESMRDLICMSHSNQKGEPNKPPISCTTVVLEADQISGNAAGSIG